MRIEKLNGYEIERAGSLNNPPTDKQKAILKAIRIALGKTYYPGNSKHAWDCIKRYKDRITLVYYTESMNEIPAICIDGKEVYRKDFYEPEEKINIATTVIDAILHYELKLHMKHTISECDQGNLYRSYTRDNRVEVFDEDDVVIFIDDKLAYVNGEFKADITTQKSSIEPIELTEEEFTKLIRGE